MDSIARPPTDRIANNPQIVLEFQRRLLNWYNEHRRVLPWRDSTDPYYILVSEIMLQQTGVERVRPIFERFVELFPDFQALAEAPRVDVLRAWAGLGYNRRAVNLHECAAIVHRDHSGNLPRDPAILRKLPGIGPYTVAAIQSFLFHEDVAAVDTNVRRVIGRVMIGADADPRETADLANRLVPHRRSAEWNGALMDLGASYCSATNPNCAACSLGDVCASASTYRVERPRRKVAEQSAPYLGSRRYIRGRIVAYLRDQPSGSLVSLSDLTHALAVSLAENGLASVEDLVRALAVEGLARVESVDGETLVGPPL